MYSNIYCYVLCDCDLLILIFHKLLPNKTFTICIKQIELTQFKHMDKPCKIDLLKEYIPPPK